MMLSTLKRFFTADPVKIAAHALYNPIVAQARKPVFYADWHVPDTLDGRFDVIVLHLFLTISRIEQAEPEQKTEAVKFIQMLSEVFFADMDRSLREMGASDTGVGIRVKKMAQAFYGRLKTYEQAIGDTSALIDALKRNVWREEAVSNNSASALATYMQRNAAALAKQTVAALMAANIQFSE